MSPCVLFSSSLKNWKRKIKLMIETKINPLCPECHGSPVSSLEKCRSCSYLVKDDYMDSLWNGCPICFSPVIVNMPFLCSDYKCSGYDIGGLPGLSSTIYYFHKPIFYIRHINLTIFFLDKDKYGNIRPSYPEKIKFIREFFDKLAIRFFDSETYFRIIRYNFVSEPTFEKFPV